MNKFTNADVLDACARDSGHWNFDHSGPVADALGLEIETLVRQKSLIDRVFQATPELPITHGPVLISRGSDHTFNVYLDPTRAKLKEAEVQRNLPHMHLSSVLKFGRDDTQSLEEKLLQAVGDLNTAADRLWREMIGVYAQHVEIDSIEELVRTLVRNAGEDVTYFVGADLACDLLTRIRGSAVASAEELSQGIVGHEGGSTIFTDANAPAEHHVLRPLEMIRIQGRAVGATYTAPVVCSHIRKRSEDQVDLEFSKTRQIFVFPNQGSITIYS